MKSFLVIGLGRFGRHLTEKLVELGNEVLILDRDEERVSRLAGIATAACVGDCQDEQALAALGVGNFDVCFVCVSEDFQSSLEATATLKELGANYVVARADREKQIRFLKKIGADDVIHAEMDMAIRAAIRFSAKNAFDYVELTPQYAIFEIETPHEWERRTVAELDIRRRYNVNILGLKSEGNIEPLLDPNYRFCHGTHLILAGDKSSGLRLMDQT